MRSYNVKVITYPDLVRQYRVYKYTVLGKDERVFKPRPRPDPERNPFDGHVCKVIRGDLDDWKDFVSEISMKRTKAKVLDYARCNNWEWFVTFTFDSKKVDRYDYEECTKKLSKWFNNLRRSCPDLSYLVVPERHKDGAYHFHGLFSGLDEKKVVWTGKYVVKRVKRGSRLRFLCTREKIYRIGHYRLGWMTATRVKDTERVTSYITKYITKDMLQGLFGRKRYWNSKNLALPVQEVYQLDEVDRFILCNELQESARFSKVSEVSYGDVTQTVSIYEV